MHFFFSSFFFFAFFLSIYFILFCLPAETQFFFSYGSICICRCTALIDVVIHWRTSSLTLWAGSSFWAAPKPYFEWTFVFISRSSTLKRSICWRRNETKHINQWTIVILNVATEHSSSLYFSSTFCWHQKAFIATEIIYIRNRKKFICQNNRVHSKWVYSRPVLLPLSFAIHDTWRNRQCVTISSKVFFLCMTQGFIQNVLDGACRPGAIYCQVCDICNE